MKCDVAFVFSPPMTLGIAAAIGRWLHGVPFVYDVQDIWPESLTATRLVEARWVLSFLNRIECFNYRLAARVTVISPGFKRHIIAKGVPPEKIEVIPNWADETVYRSVVPDAALAERLGMRGRFNIVYAGNMGVPQSLSTAIAAAARLQDMPEIQFVFVGDGVERERLESEARGLGLQNVRFLGRKGAEEMPPILALADVFLVHLRRDPLFAITIPCKTIAYLAGGRPVLAAIEGDAAQVITDAKAGIQCAPEDPAAMEFAVRQLRVMPEQALRQMGANARQAFESQYTREVLVTRFEDIFEAVRRETHAAQRTS
jgi:glycosyltransferase involved in cell wall biosynthesis